MTLDQKRWVIGGLGFLFLLSLVSVQWLEVSRRRHEEAGGRPSAAMISVPDASRQCVDCHTQVSRGIVDHWTGSTHAEKGVACVDCHKADAKDADMFSHYGQPIATIVTPRDCARCHPAEQAEFAISHHSKAGNILASLDNFLAETVAGSRVPFNPHSPTPGKAVNVVNGMAPANSGCQQCHGSLVGFQANDGGVVTMRDLKPDDKGQPTNLDAVGRIARNESGKPLLSSTSWPNTGIGRINLDGSLGSCAACHSRHDFSSRRARQPENCGKCHLGPDHPQKEIYDESKHGVAFRDLIGEMNLDARPWVVGRDYSAAPTCATCHMSANLRNGMKITHDPGERISWTNRPPVSLVMDTDASHAVVTETDPEKRRAAIADTADAKRNRMKQVCSTCHTPDYINLFYRQYDDVVINYNEKFAKPGQAIMAALASNGLLTKTQYDEQIEWTWYYLWHHEGRRARMGASMMAPDYTQWHGMFEVGERFYMKLIPEARAITAAAARGGRAQNARAADAVIDEILARPEHQWLLKGAEPQADAIAQEMQRKYGQGQEMSIERRTFLKMAGIAVPAVAAYSCADREEAARLGANADPIDRASVSWDKAPCRFCGTGCGVMVGVEKGRVVAVRGDEASPVNRGLLCVKGYHLPGLLYGEDRLQHPQRRNADGSFSRISWDEALDLIATKFKETLAQHGPESVAVYESGQWTVFDGYAALKWVKGGLRSNNIEPNARLCMASAVSGFLTQFQSDEPMGCYQDLDRGDDFVLWGNNMAEMHPVLFSRILETRRVKPATRIIDIATRQTPTTDYADMHVLFKPGTDLALANGILHLLVAEGRIHQAFIDENVVFRRGIEDVKQIGYGCFDAQAERYTFEDEPRPSSLAELSTFLQDYTPDKVSAITGVPVEQIRALAAIYGDLPRGTVSLWCMGVNQHVRGTWMNNLITDLHLITGKICRPGANPLSLTGQPSACGTAREVGTSSNRLPADMVVTNPEHRAEAEHIWNLPAGTISAKPGPHAIDMFRALKRGDIKTMWIQTTNPWVTLPNRSRFDRAPNDGKFIVVSDIYPTPTTAMADLILPAAAWVEREGVFGNTERRTQQWNKMVDPPGEAREDAWAVIQVAKRMGMGNLFPWPDDNWHEPMFEEYRRFGVGHGKDLAAYAQLKETRGMVWPVVNGKETFYRYTAGYDPYVKKASGAHFYKAVGYGEKAAFWLRPYHPPAESPDKQYPFWLTTGRVLEHWHSGSMTRRIKQLHQAVPAAYLEMNRADAEEMSLKKGDRVKIVSRRGSLELVVEVDGRGRPPRGTVFVPFFDEAKLINLVTLDAMDNISKQPDYKKCAIRIERA